MANAVSASTGSITVATTSIPSRRSTEETTVPSDSEKIPPTACTSLVTRVTRSPAGRRAW